jgi:hypothetical protein
MGAEERGRRTHVRSYERLCKNFMSTRQPWEFSKIATHTLRKQHSILARTIPLSLHCFTASPFVLSCALARTPPHVHYMSSSHMPPCVAFSLVPPPCVCRVSLCVTCHTLLRSAAASASAPHSGQHLMYCKIVVPCF